MPTPDFVFLDGQAVRATSLTPTGDGGHRLVVVARGDADRDRLLDLLRDPALIADLGDGDVHPVAASGIDVHTSGEGARAIHRVDVVLRPASPHAAGTGAARSIDDRLDTIIALLTEIRDALRAPR
jgi:hypothetical protein